MKHLILAAFLALAPFTSEAGPPPEPPKGGINYFFSSDCVDNETGAKGQCHAGRDKDGIVYLTFYQGDELMFIRRIVGEDYEKIWVNDKFETF